MKRKFIDLHCHTGEGSLRDTGSTAAQLVAREKALGATAMAVTDHGTMAAIQDFRVACEKTDEETGEKPIKPIYGCEFYTDIGDGARTHFIVLAKNFNGYQAISKVNTETAYNMHDGKPIATFDMFERWFGRGSLGYNNVIATSACIAGPLARKLLQNYDYQKDIDKIDKKRSLEKSASDKIYQKALKKLDSLQAELDEIKTRKEANSTQANTKWKAIWNKANRSGDVDAIAEAESLKKMVEIALDKKPKIRAEETKKSAEIKVHKEFMAPMERSVEKYNKYTNAINELEAKKVSKEVATEEAEALLKYLLSLFGKDNYYVELQYHGIDKEADAMPILAEIARKYKTPLVATNDVHYAFREDAKKRHCNFVQHNAGFWRDMEPSDWELYIKDTEEMTECLEKILPADVVEEALNNTFVIADKCNTEFVIGTHYPKFPCKEGAKLHLRSLISKGKSKIKPWTEEYQKRLEYELKTIESMGFSDYLCIVEDFLNYARIIGKLNLNSKEFLDHQFDIKYLEEMAKGQVGEGCGPGRGSAAGSLVCYLVGITNINPIENDLLFERFLNPQRVSMPDIDSDIAPNVRPFIIDYIKNKYGEKSVCQIMTRSYFGAKSSIQAAARVMGKKCGDEKAYLGLSLELSKSIDESKAFIDDIESDLLAINDSDDAKEIIKIAKLLQGLPSGYGTHAAGIIISDNGDVSEYTPLMDVSGAIDCQLDLNWVEPMGMLKLDLLGLRNLGIITECEKAVQKAYGVNLSMDEFPEEPEVFSNIFAKGLTNGVFQFESDGMKKTLMNFGPTSISDLTILNAVFRPGPIQYIDDITAGKKGEKEPDYIIPEMAEILDSTYGKPVYQEQIMAIFNKLAGFSLGESDIIRRYMSKKKVDKFLAYKDKFIEGLVSKGAAEKAANDFWTELIDFSSYAFNKSHARAYVAVAYATAYLKYKYPEAYSCGLLNYTATDKMAKMILDAKNSGVSIKCPDINLSGTEFSLHGTDVIYGLRPIPQVSASAQKIIDERANGPYISFKDFLERVYPKKNVTENLIKTGALDKFGKRASLLAALPDLLDILKKIRAKKDIINSETDEKRLIRTQASLDKLVDDYNNKEFEEVTADKIEELNTEKELLGYYISAHPMDGMKIKHSLKDVELGVNSTIIALATDFEYKMTKAGKLMLVLNISDTTEIIPTIVFPGDLEKFTEELKENTIYKIYGQLKRDGENLKFFAKSFRPYKAPAKPIFLNCPSEEVYNKFKERLYPWVNEESGLKCLVYLQDKKRYEPFELPVSPDIKKEEKALWK